MKKFFQYLLVVILLLSLFTACGTKTDSVLNKIKTDGKIVVGTSADYAPYEYIDEAGNKTGFDIELMEEIGKRMGLEIEWQDMPFDSLVAAVANGKLDMSISCFNYDTERDLTVDFSEAYYTTEDAFVVASTFTGEFSVPEDAAKYKIGVQSGTMQDDWITENLINAGLMPEANLSRYERVDQVALDLLAGRIDIMMADHLPVLEISKKNPDLKIVYQGELSTGPINIVLREGDTAIKKEIDKVIKILQDEGFIDELAKKYFSE